MAYNIKYPRVAVSKARHQKLAREAKQRSAKTGKNVSIQSVAEEIFKAAEKK